MKAAFATKYGSPEVIEIQEVSKPIPRENELLVKVHATSVTAGDSRIRGARFPKGFKIPARLFLGVFAPRNKILGTEFSGVVEEVGKKVTKFKSGDEVIGFKLFNVHAEYTFIREEGAVVSKPKKLSFEEAAAIPFGGTTAYYFLKQAKVKKGETVLVNGASGEVGCMSVQIAKAFGANVTGVCGERNMDLVKSLGADSVIDYKKTNILESQNKYDVILDAVGNLNFSSVQHILNSNGRFLGLVAGIPEMIKGGFARKKEGKKFIAGTAPEKKEDLEFLVDLINQNKLKAVIGETFEFKDIAKAHEYVDGGHKVGSAVVRM
jgi:NADPH:quinone reductase-like Zn-dependent oxidoreductase